MHLKTLAAALALACPLASQAQTSVTVYGMLDAALAHEDANTPAIKSRTAIHAAQASSRLGFRGNEDLGNGLKAMFNLEAGYAVDTGAGDAALFGRRAVVGLEGSFGQVTLGREYTPIDNISSASHILGQGFYGSNLNAFANGRMTRRLSNSLNYKSKSMSGFKLSAAIGLGETSTGPSQDTTTAALEYQNGPLYAGVGYAVVERLAAGDDKEMIFGAAYAMGALEFKGNYMVGNLVGSGNKYTQANIGAAMTFGPGKLFANLQQSKLENGATGNGYALSYSHSLSKRTNVYGSYATTRNNQLATFSLSAAGSSINLPASAAGADPRALALGMRHTF